MLKHILFLAALTLSPAMASAQISQDPVLVKECSSCHLAFSAGWLPQASWKKIIDGLPNHFGDDARLPEDRRAQVEAALMAGAGDAKTGRSSPFIKGVNGEEGILRLTETMGFQRKHKKFKPGTPMMTRAKSLANCQACHPKAAEGIFED